MNIQTALLPHKHIRFCESVVAIAGFIRTLLAEPRTIDELWLLLDKKHSGWPGNPPFEYLVYAVDLLFALRQIDMLDHDDRIYLRTSK